MPPKKKLEADRHTADVERGFSAQNLICTSQRLSSYVSDTQSKIIALIWSLELLFDYFWVTLIVWSAIQPQWALFFHFIIIFAELSGISYFVLHCIWVWHRTQVSYHLGIDTGITCQLVQSWNWKNKCTASWDWMACQTASAAQKWAEMEVKWDKNFGH